VLELAVIIPTLNEAANVPPLLDRLQNVLAGVDWEVIFVDDDSRDDTAAVVRRFALENPHVRLIERIGRAGLASACIEGMLATAAPYLAVMDADLQHDESLLPQMVEKLRCGGTDLVVASRNLPGGSTAGLGPERRILSRVGAAVSRLVCHCQISDPMSGFFMLRRDVLQEVVRRLSGSGFKILVDILASAGRPLKVAELPYEFRNRLHGASKLDVNVGFEYLVLLLEKLLGDLLPVRFVLFGIVGSLGVVLNLIELWLLYRVLTLSFTAAQAIAAGVAMVTNFFLNNVFTYRDLRLRGWRMVAGLLSFCIACSAGALINVVLATVSLERGFPWPLAATLGLVVGSVWNYSVTSVLTWRKLRRRAGCAG
jgi:dolichol-phosphate mannosyltransferase